MHTRSPALAFAARALVALVGSTTAYACASTGTPDGPSSETPPASAGPCSTMGCTSSLTIEVPVSEHDAGAGDHRVAVMLDDVEHTCTLAHSDRATTDQAVCGDAIVSLGPAMEAAGATPEVPGTVGVGSRPVPGAYVLRMTVQRVVSRVRITHGFEGRAVSENVVQPEYAMTYPNGPGCAPVCRSAHVVVD